MRRYWGSATCGNGKHHHRCECPAPVVVSTTLGDQVFREQKRVGRSIGDIAKGDLGRVRPVAILIMEWSPIGRRWVGVVGLTVPNITPVDHVVAAGPLILTRRIVLIDRPIIAWAKVKRDPSACGSIQREEDRIGGQIKMLSVIRLIGQIRLLDIGP